MVAREAHNLQIEGSNPSPATKFCSTDHRAAVYG